MHHIALFRGINVGKAKRVAMADLRQLFEELGAGEARTLLNSGNVVFTLPAAQVQGFAGEIENALEPKTGVKSRVTLISGRELDAIIAQNPLREAEAEPSRFLVAVLAEPAAKQKVEPLAKQEWLPDAMAFGPRVVYLWCRSGILESKLAAAAGKALGEAATTRNWATMLKLQALTRGAAA